MHRYFVDVKVKFKSGKIYLIEIKPEIQTKPPVKKKRKSQKYLKEVMTYIKNESKWEQAEKYCKQRGWEFKIFTENTLKSLGIRLLTT
jgi:aldehyde:ferredoxin oxidoreductase